MRIALIALTKNGKKVGEKIGRALEGHDVTFYANENLGKLVKKIFHAYDALVFVMALGIVVRVVSGIRMKKGGDPAVVVVDEKGKHVISVLSGHYGANELAALIASRIRAKPVITTATEVQGKTSVEALAKKFCLAIENVRRAKAVNAAIVNGERMQIFSDFKLGRLPGNMIARGLSESNGDAKSITITNKNIRSSGVVLRPKNLVVGIGTKSGISKAVVLGAVRKALSEVGLSIKSVKALATADFRVNEEGVVKAAAELGVPLLGIEKNRIKEIEGDFECSEYVRAKVGIGCVAEPCAVLACASKYKKLVQKKIKFKGVTVAIAEELGLGTSKQSLRKQERKSSLSPCLRRAERGKICIVGIGPGSMEQMTPSARSAIENAEVIIGYKTYLQQVRDLAHGKRVIKSGMGQEVERASAAVSIAQSGKKVAVVSSGDPGIYAMASVVFEHLNKRKIKVDVEVVPGITAASAAAALLGSPLGNDFAVISLSDLLTPWEVVEKRLENAAKGDFVVVIYNPKSKGREKQIEKAASILLEHRKPSAPVGVVRNAMKDGQRVEITTLGEMLGCRIDMASTVIVGSSETFIHGDKIVTPRGYARKYEI